METGRPRPRRAGKGTGLDGDGVRGMHCLTRGLGLGLVARDRARENLTLDFVSTQDM